MQKGEFNSQESIFVTMTLDRECEKDVLALLAYGPTVTCCGHLQCHAHLPSLFRLPVL